MQSCTRKRHQHPQHSQTDLHPDCRGYNSFFENGLLGPQRPRPKRTKEPRRAPESPRESQNPEKQAIQICIQIAVVTIPSLKMASWAIFGALKGPPPLSRHIYKQDFSQAMRCQTGTEQAHSRHKSKYLPKQSDAKRGRSKGTAITTTTGPVCVGMVFVPTKRSMSWKSSVSY